MELVTGLARKRSVVIFHLVWVLGIILLGSGPAKAHTSSGSIIEVNSLLDIKKDDGLCTLREAVIAANSNKRSGYKPGECAAGNYGRDEIRLKLAGTYTLTLSDYGTEDWSKTGDLDIRGDVTITPLGHPAIIDASKITDRVFHLHSGEVVISGVTIKGGKTKYGGGGIYNKAELTLENSTISGNKTEGEGGGIFNAGTGKLTLNFVTIADNSAKRGGGIKNYKGWVNLRSSIIAANKSIYEGDSADCQGISKSYGHNLFGKKTGCPVSDTDLTVDPDHIFTSVFGALETDGELVGVHALLPGSPAINAGHPTCPPPAADQRGVSRPQESACDIGAYEFAEPAQVSPFVVNTIDDIDDGLCSFKHCSLREAIRAANKSPNGESPEQIHFDLPVAGAIQPTSALPAISDPVVIDGTTQPAPFQPVELNGSQAGAGVNGLAIEAGGSSVIGLVIDHFDGDGLLLATNGNNRIQENVITVNGDNGIQIAASGNILQDNMISDNGADGVRVESGTGNTILNNRFSGNGGLGINLGNDAETPNDIGDPDSGPNNQQNFPVLARAIPTNGNTTLEGRLNSLANTPFNIQFFSNQSCDPTMFGEGGNFLTAISATTNISGSVSFTTLLPDLMEDRFVTATATDPGGNTSEFSQCLPVTADNDTWPRALRLTPGSGPVVVEQVLDQLGQSRWYKFSIQPNSQVIVTLTSLPANYDLTVYKDIAAAFEQLTSSQDLVKLSAEFAPDAFAPDAFAPGARSPDAFAPGARSPDAFAPEAFSAAVFAPGARSPDAFAPGARSPDAFAPGARSPDIFAPDAFSPDAFAPGARSPDAIAPGARSPDFFTAFSNAQTRSLIGASAFEGTSGEGIIVNTWNNTGDFYVRVRGRDGAFNLDDSFRLEVEISGNSCDGVSALPVPGVSAGSGNYETIILTDLERMAGATTDLEARLNSFAAQVNGVVVDVHDRVEALNNQADTHFECPYAKNLVAEAIREVVLAYRAVNPLKYVVIVGNDDAIPFFRYPDNALLGNETDYIPPVLDFTTSQASLRLGYVLGQDAYGAQTEVSFKASSLPVPDLAVGRLVETPDDIITVLDAFDETNGGVIPTPTSSFVSGYDFLEDAANEVQAELEAGIGNPADTLVALQQWSPADPRSWTAAQLADAFLGSRHDIVFLAGHFSAQSALAADYTTRLTTDDLLESDVDLTNAIIFSAGCHSGYNIVNDHNVPDVTIEPDWAQAFAQKGALFIGGTGYQYGDTDFIEYGERLYLEFSRQLRAGSGPVSVGEALVAAKQVYMATTPDLSGLHEKSLLQSTLFGLPMLRVDMPGARFNRPGNSPSVGSLNTFATNPGSTLGLAYTDLTVNATFSEHTFQLKNLNDDSTVEAFYLRGGDGIVTQPDEPVLPLEMRNVSVANTVLRGVGFRGGDFADDQDVLPLTGAPTTEIRGVHSTFLTDIFYPVQPWRVNYFEALANGSGGATQLMVTPAQFKSSSPGASTGTLRRFNNMNLRLYYSNNMDSFTTDGIVSTPALAAAPMIVDISGTPGSGQVDFSARVVGDPSAGIQEVWVTYTALSGPPAGRWQSLDLSQDPDDSTLWAGSLTLPAGTLSSEIRYIIQAVNGVGLVSLDTNQGAYYIPGVTAGPGQATTIVLETPPASSGPYGSQATFSARLTQSSDGQPLVGRAVTFSLGPQSRVAVTGNDGRATATLPLLGVPGSYEVRVSFAGTGGDAPSATLGTFTITKQNTQLSLASASVTGHPDDEVLLLATLTDATGLPLAERTVLFILEGDNASGSIPVITDYLGQAKLGRLSLPFGSYNVTVYFNGPIPLHTGDILNSKDVRYNAASPVSGLLTLENIIPEALDDSYETDEDVTLTVTAAQGLLSNDSDDGEVLTATLASPPLSGTLILEPGGAFTYTPALDFTGLVTFTYQADDGADLSNTATVSITVKPINDPPLTQGDSYEVVEDTVLIVPAPGVLENDIDVDGDTLVASLLASPTEGDLALTASGAFTYTPEANFNGTDSFVYQAGDGTVLSSMTMVTITVTPANDPLVAGDATVTTPEEQGIKLSITELITDVDGEVTLASLEVIEGPSHGITQVDLPAGKINYESDLDFNGTDVFTYQVGDGEFSDTGVITVVVTPVNDPPVANDDLAVTDENVPVMIDILANDTAGPPDEDQSLKIDDIATPGYGTAHFDEESGQIIYTPKPKFSGEDSFNYIVCDSEELCDDAIVSVSVNLINSPPVATDDSYTINEDGDLTVDEADQGVLANDTDVDGDPLSASLVSEPAHGQLVLYENGSFSYTPEANFNGTDSFTYQTSDGVEISNVATVMITVNPVNDPPVVNDDLAATDENTPVVIDVLANDTAGPPDEDQSLTITDTGTPSKGTAVAGEAGQIIYTPNHKFSGEDSFTYIVCDSEALCGNAKVTISVAVVNDPPIANDDSYATDEDEVLTVGADQGVLANDTDSDDDPLVASLVSEPAHGQLVFNEDGSFTYTPEEHFSGTDSFTYQVNDGTASSNVATVTITVVPVTTDLDCSTAVPNPAFVWPPNNSFVPISIEGINGDGDETNITIEGIFQDEPVGKKPDGEGLGSSTPEVRAERDGQGDGRVYHIEFKAETEGGNSCTGEVLVVVTHDQGVDPGTVDGGALYDSVTGEPR